MVEYVNTVPFLEGFGGRILPAAAIQLFQLSMSNMKTINPMQGHNYVQAPVGSLHEARLHLSSLQSAASKRPPPKKLHHWPKNQRSNTKQNHTTICILLMLLLVYPRCRLLSSILPQSKTASTTLLSDSLQGATIF
jgi:hypothetical protein